MSEVKIVYNIYVAVRKLWNAIFGKNGDGSQLVIPGRISGASGDVTVGDGLNLTNNVMKSTVPVVSANPETAESDPELTGLMIGSNKYKMPSGGGITYERIYTNPTIGQEAPTDLTIDNIGSYKMFLFVGCVDGINPMNKWSMIVPNITDYRYRIVEYGKEDGSVNYIYGRIFGITSTGIHSYNGSSINMSSGEDSASSRKLTIDYIYGIK